MSFLSSYFGRIQFGGVSVDSGDALNFTSGFRAAYNSITGAVDLTPDPAATATFGGLTVAGVKQSRPVAGSDLEDADAEITVAGGSMRVMQDNTLSASRVITINPSGSQAGQLLVLELLDTDDTYTVTVENDGGEIFAKPVSNAVRVTFQRVADDFELLHWIEVEV